MKLVVLLYLYIVLGLLRSSIAYRNSNIRTRKLGFRSLSPANILSRKSPDRNSSINSRLYLDIFGLGPPEVIIIAGVAAFLYGPDRIKKQLREKGVKGSIVSDGWRAEREENIKLLRERAVVTRRSRAIKFLQDAVADDVPEVVDLVNEFNEIYDTRKNP